MDSGRDAEGREELAGKAREKRENKDGAGEWRWAGGLRICETSKLQPEYDGLGAGVQGDGRRRAQWQRQRARVTE